MTEVLFGLFLFGVIALVVGCFVYLHVTRDQSRPGQALPSRGMAKKATELSGSYRLSDLDSIFEQLGAIEAWGMFLELKLTTVREDIQMIVNRNEVELCSSRPDPSDTDPFRRAAREVGLQVRAGYVEEQYCVDVKGTWPEIARTIRSISRSIYGVGDSEEIQVRIFN